MTKLQAYCKQARKTPDRFRSGLIEIGQYVSGVYYTNDIHHLVNHSYVPWFTHSTLTTTNIVDRLSNQERNLIAAALIKMASK